MYLIFVSHALNGGTGTCPGVHVDLKGWTVMTDDHLVFKVHINKKVFGK